MLTVESALRKDRTTKPTLEHRHFAFIAQVISEIENLRERERMAIRFADACAATNPRFDHFRFIKACGL